MKYICNKFKAEESACNICPHAEPHEKEEYGYIDNEQFCTEIGDCSLDGFGLRTIRVKCIPYTDK